MREHCSKTRLQPSQVIVYRIQVKNLDAVSISGVVNASVDGVLAASFSADIGGVTSLTIAGSAAQQRVSLDGVSTYLAGGLVSESVVVTGSGVMTAEVQVSSLLDGDVCGAGSITYVGMPTVLLRACPGIVVGPKVGGSGRGNGVALRTQSQPRGSDDRAAITIRTSTKAGTTP